MFGEIDDEPDTSCIDCNKEGWVQIVQRRLEGYRKVWVCADCYSEGGPSDDPTDDGDAALDMWREDCA